MNARCLQELVCRFEISGARFKRPMMRDTWQLLNMFIMVCSWDLIMISQRFFAQVFGIESLSWFLLVRLPYAKLWIQDTVVLVRWTLIQWLTHLLSLHHLKKPKMHYHSLMSVHSIEASLQWGRLICQKGLEDVLLQTWNTMMVIDHWKKAAEREMKTKKKWKSNLCHELIWLSSQGWQTATATTATTATTTTTATDMTVG